MVPMRDGIRLATDVYRPAREGEIVEGSYPTILCRTPYDKTDKRYIEIADFFVPHGYTVCLQDCRDRYRSEGTREYFHAATPHEGEDGYDTVEWIAEQRWSTGRVGTVGSSFAGITQVRMALERPPHLTAIWPDVVPTNSFQHQSREGGAMQLHMFWALFIHAQDAQDIADDPEKQADVWADLTRLRELFWETPYREGQTSLRHVPTLEKCLLDYYTRGSYDELWSRKEYDYTRYWDEHADIPGTYSTGWYDGFPHSDTEYFAAMAAKNTAPQRLVVGPWSHVGMRGDATYTLDVDFGPDAAWGVQRYFAEQLAFFDRWLKEDDSAPVGEAPIRIFVMGGGSGRKTALGKLDHGGRWREEHEWPLARAVEAIYYLGGAGSLSLEPPQPGEERVEEPRRFVYDPAHPVPTIGGNYCSVGELPAEGAGMEPAWSRFLSPVLRLRNILTPGPADQAETPEFFATREPYPRLSERADVLVYETEPLEEPIEVTGRARVNLWVSSSAVDTDFTAKLVDVHPANEDYPDGYDMLINDSIIRCRYREGFEQEVFLTPGEVVPVSIELPPTSNLFAAGHRIRIDISSSNFPRLDLNPNTGEPIGRHTHQVVAEQAVYADAERPSHVVLPVVAD
jgi:putative CocE/NonD family hydrolase